MLIYCNVTSIKINYNKTLKPKIKIFKVPLYPDFSQRTSLLPSWSKMPKPPTPTPKCGSDPLSPHTWDVLDTFPYCCNVFITIHLLLKHRPDWQKSVIFCISLSFSVQMSDAVFVQSMQSIVGSWLVMVRCNNKYICE